MEYSRIELKGYKRLQLNQIQLIRIEPKQVIQLILGTNGSGKSSLLREITPLPSSYSDYEKGGYKHLDVNHKGRSYKIINQFDGKSGKYQLLRDNVELFSGSTVTDFRTLIKQEFGITPEIQSMIDGVTRFSTMDISKRRYWFTLLSQADYTYAFKYYSKLKSRIRDLQGSLNIDQNRYASEKSKELTEEEVKSIYDKITLYRDTIYKLLEMKPKTHVIRKDLEQSLYEQDKQLKLLTDKVNQLRLTLSKYYKVQTPEELINYDACNDIINKLTGIAEYYREKIKNLENEIENENKDIDKFQKVQHVSVQELKDQRQLTIKKIEDHTKQLRHNIDIISVENFKTAFYELYDNLTRIFEELPKQGAECITQEIRDNLLNQQNSMQMDLIELRKQINLYQTQIGEMDYAKIHHQRTCPKCNHSWYHGYDEQRYNYLKNELDKLIHQEHSYTEQINNNHEKLIEYDRVLGLKQLYYQFVRNWSVLNPIWETLLSMDIFKSPKTTLLVLEEFRQDLSIHLKLEVYRKELIHFEELLSMIEFQSKSDVDKRQIRLEHLGNELSNIYDQYRQNNEHIKSYQKIKEIIKTSMVIKEQLDQTFLKRDQSITSLNDSLKSEHINRLVTIFREELSVIEQKISKIDLQRSILEQIKTQIEEHQEQIRLLKLAESAMSPSTGLIAKGLTGFINWFISRMNSFVKHIWTYPLEILPIHLNKDDMELDYKFPVEIDHQFRAPDVKVGECNNSTCEIFDLAFRIVAMECLKLNTYPLQLDEFGSSFDHKHRNVAFQVVTGLTNSTDIPQIFMVSHAEQSYSSLRNCDITVLHSDNISIPEGVILNEHTYIV